MPKRRRCPTCGRLVGTYATGLLHHHHRPGTSRRCPTYGVSALRERDVRKVIVEHGVNVGSKMLGTTHKTLARYWGDRPWWPKRQVRYVHTGHAPGQRYRRGCAGCIERRRAQHDRHPDVIAARALAAQRRRERERVQAAADREEEGLAADRAYIAEMIRTGKALNLRRALGISARAVEEEIGLGRTALNKIENGRRPAMTRVKEHARRYAAILARWERAAHRRGIDYSKPQPRVRSVA